MEDHENLANRIVAELRRAHCSHRKLSKLEGKIQDILRDIPPAPFFGDNETLLKSLAEVEKKYIEYIYKITGGNKSAMMRILKISRQGLYDKLDVYGLHNPIRKSKRYA